MQTPKQQKINKRQLTYHKPRRIWLIKKIIQETNKKKASKKNQKRWDTIAQNKKQAVKSQKVTCQCIYTNQNKPAAEHVRETSSKTTESLLMERLPLIHNKTDLKTKKDNLHLINVWTFS